MSKEKNKRNRNKTSVIVCIIAAAILLSVAIYNIVVDSTGFWKTNVTSLLSILAVLFISYYLTQMRNDERKKIDNIERLILKIQQEVASEKIIHGKSNMCLMYQRSINNKIEYLQNENLTSISDELKYIHEQFQSLRDMYGEHMNDSNFPGSIEPDFNRIIVNIVDKCDMMLIELRK